MSKSLYDKIWERHLIADRHGSSLIYVDRHLLHEGSRNAFLLLRERGLSVLRPKQTFGFADHLVPVRGEPKSVDEITNGHARDMAKSQITNCDEFGIRLYGLGDRAQGIVHVVGPEQGITLPGTTIVCGDSHTSTHGAFAALAFGIGSTEIVHVLSTQCLWQQGSRNVRIFFDGKFRPGVGAKDAILALIRRIGANGGAGCVFEYAGEAVAAMTMEERMTLCNMSVEAGARAGLIGVDDTTIEYLAGREYSPKGELWEKAIKAWRDLNSDSDAQFDAEHRIDCSELVPQVTWGISPEDVVDINGIIPNPARCTDSAQRAQMELALHYMGLTAGDRIDSVSVDRVFIGSCTNGRLSDLRDAARLLKGKKVGVPTMVVPGSSEVRRQAEAESLDQIFKDSGCEWLAPGCSMCLGMNGDIGRPKERCASTSNRNFRGRQGPGVRTHLVSPLVAAATAIAGKFADPTTFTK
jgi:3-isopropylmalate/(R)-2-methylmalate dehydratase large subunit